MEGVNVAAEIRDGTAVLVHSSDVHVEEDRGLRAASGVAGLAAVLATARRLRADAVLLAGDTFDNARISNRVLREAGELVAAAGLPVVLLPGNHDPGLADGVFHRAGLLDLPGVHVLGMNVPAHVTLRALDVQVWGRPHLGDDDMRPLCDPPTRNARWQVALAHGHYVPPADAAREAHRFWKITDADILASGADYVALGHWDRAASVGDGRVPAAYSGSPDFAGTVNVVRLGPGFAVRFEREPVVWL